MPQSRADACLSGNQARNYLAVVSRTLLFTIMWWALTDGAADSWWIGIPAVIGVTAASLALVPASGIIWRKVPGFVCFFLWHSLKGGIDVAGRAFHPRMPIAPELVEYSLRLPAGLPQVLMANSTSLLPGTLSAAIEGRVLNVHVLDSHGDFLVELKALEQRIGRMWIPGSDEASTGGE